MISMKYRGGMAYVIYCAHCGMESIGVISPLISWNMMMKKNITYMHCCMFDDPLAMVIPIPDMTRLNRNVAI
jgi:hypothetical protein